MRVKVLREGESGQATSEDVTISLSCDRPAILVLSGASWTCTGGGQRPTRLAIELARLGWPTVFSSNVQHESKWDSGVFVARWRDVQRLGLRPGVCIAGHPSFYSHAQSLKDAGWRIIYDCMDDWSAFHRSGYGADVSREEAAILDIADAVTASARSLSERLQREGCGNVVLIPNGGPSAPIKATPAKPWPGRVDAIYVGYLYGPWFDWSALDELNRSGVKVIVIGEYTSVPDWENVRFVGEKPREEVLSWLPWATVGIIPFRDPPEAEGLCATVDPIKWYEYRAAGLRVVASAALTELSGRSATELVSSPAEWGDAVKRALHQGPAPVGADEVMAQSWAARAEVLSRIVARLLRPAKLPRARELRPRNNLRPEDCRLRVSWQAPATCTMWPPCPYCSTIVDRQDKPALCGNVEEWRLAWRWLTRLHGPLYLSCCFGDAISDPEFLELISELARYNKVDLVTNAIFPLSFLDVLPRNGNVALATSFQPLYWDYDVDAFIAKRRAIEAAGIRCGTVEICGYPPFLPYLPKWFERFAEEGITASVLPFWGHYEGRAYPQSYTDEERALVYGRVRDIYEYSEALTDIPEGTVCRAGRDYIYVCWDGEVRRCLWPPILGHMLRGPYLTLLSAPERCSHQTCPCPDLWRYRHPGDDLCPDTWQFERRE